jgi:hypothetical protein
LVSIATSIDIISVEIVVVIDVHVSAAMPVAVTPAPSPSRADGNPGPKSKHSVTRRIGIRIWISGCAVNNTGAVLRNINYFRVRWLNDDDLFVVDRLSFDFLLLARFQISVALGLGSHALNRVHHIGLLREEGVAQIHCPRDMLA